MQKQIYWTECPRDAMQGWPNPISTQSKIEYLQALLNVGYQVLDAGSFVSPKAIPQMADSAQVFNALDTSNTKTKLLAIVANLRGTLQAVEHNNISYLGYPFSVSPTFQMRNTQATLEQSFKTVIETQNLCLKHNKKLVVYISMAFGNPYQDAYHPSIVSEWIDKLSQEGITHFSLADTVAIANHQSIKQLFETVIPEFAQCTIGAHLHTTQANWQQNIHAAIQAGCTVWDSAIGGIGGCPMATDTLSGNLATENLLDYITQQNISHSLNTQALSQCITLSKNIFQKKEGS